MAVTWNVQPYRWLYELRREYTRSTIVLNRKDAKGMVDQIDEWMFTNAPWEDQTGDARHGLFVKLKGAESEAKKFQRERSQQNRMQEAIKHDFELLNKINRIRTEYNVERRLEAEAAGKRRPADRFQPLKRVPSGYSQVSEVRKQIRQEERDLTPIVTIEIGHDKDLRYAIWLEIANGGRFSIIKPTMDYWGHKLFERVKRNARLLNSRLTLAEEVEPADLFKEYVARQNEAREKAGRKAYEPWDPTLNPKERKRRREHYNPEWAREYYKRTKEAKQREQGRGAEKELADVRAEQEAAAKIYVEKQNAAFKEVKTFRPSTPSTPIQRRTMNRDPNKPYRLTKK